MEVITNGNFEDAHPDGTFVGWHVLTTDYNPIVTEDSHSLRNCARLAEFPLIQELSRTGLNVYAGDRSAGTPGEIRFWTKNRSDYFGLRTLQVRFKDSTPVLDRYVYHTQAVAPHSEWSEISVEVSNSYAISDITFFATDHAGPSDIVIDDVSMQGVQVRLLRFNFAALLRLFRG